MFKMRSELLVLKNTIFCYKIRIFGCQNTNFCFSKLAGLKYACKRLVKLTCTNAKLYIDVTVNLRAKRE